MKNKLIYLDNAATSFPKPDSVYEAVTRAMREECGNPGRSGHRLSLAAGRIVSEARFLCARLFNAESPDNIIFTSNTTVALNMAIKGLIESGDHIITSSLEHNSVSRQLFELQNMSVEVTKLATDITSGLNPDDLKKALRPNTKLVVCTHISNVTGTVNDIAAIGNVCGNNGLVFLVDAAQSAGVRPIDVRGMSVDMLAFPGHKGLLGPQGTGGLYVKPGLNLKTIIQGGTGSNSELLSQPNNFPEKFESGTLNTPGLAGLAAGIRFILETGVETITQREEVLTDRLLDGIKSLKGIRVTGSHDGQNRGSVVSLCFENLPPTDAAIILDTAYNIAVRSGLHCAADAHRHIGTLDSGGTVRISPNFFNTEEDIDNCLAALKTCAKGL
jgi:cysteine desulfurase family protein